MSEAKSKAKDTIEESEMRAKQIIADMEDRVKALIEQYKKLETAREDMVSELKRLASEVMDKVDRARNVGKDFDADNHLSSVRREAKRIAFPNMDYERPPKKEAPAPVQDEADLEDNDTPEEQPKKTQKSFFDAIG